LRQRSIPPAVFEPLIALSLCKTRHVVGFPLRRLLDDARAFVQLNLLIGMLLYRGAKYGSRDRDIRRVGQRPFGPALASPDNDPKSVFVSRRLGLLVNIALGVKRLKRKFGGMER
jgi:hypothetical protein